MDPEIVIAIYRPREGQGDALAALIAKHVPTLRAEGLITDRAPIVMRSRRDGTCLEVFEWARADASQDAHENAAVAEIWRAMGEIADLITLGDLAEADTRFPHFEPVSFD